VAAGPVKTPPQENCSVQLRSIDQLLKQTTAVTVACWRYNLLGSVDEMALDGRERKFKRGKLRRAAF
jgi:hypothetical protein